MLETQASVICAEVTICNISVVFLRHRVYCCKENSRKYLPFGKKIVKIGAVDTEIALLIVKKKKKLTQVKYIARSATQPSGLNYMRT